MSSSGQAVHQKEGEGREEKDGRRRTERFEARTRMTEFTETGIPGVKSCLSDASVNP